MINVPKRVLVTSALPYAEGKPHLGNLFTIVAADVARRFYEIAGSEVLFVSR
jgi:methionyl-tRNA synthetase